MFEPAFQITPSILKSIGEIEAARAVIENSPLIPLYERQFKTEATIRKVHFSTAIEGNYLDLAEVKRILDAGEALAEGSVDGYIKKVTEDGVVARQRDIHEVINYRNVVN